MLTFIDMKFKTIYVSRKKTRKFNLKGTCLRKQGWAFVQAIVSSSNAYNS